MEYDKVGTGVQVHEVAKWAHNAVPEKVRLWFHVQVPWPMQELDVKSFNINLQYDLFVKLTFTNDFLGMKFRPVNLYDFGDLRQKSKAFLAVFDPRDLPRAST